MNEIILNEKRLARNRARKAMYRRRRILALILAVGMILIIAFSTRAIKIKADEKKNVVYRTEFISVENGDTLWNIAKYVNNKSYYKRDVREVVYDIKELNNIGNEHIYPGQLIEVKISEYNNN